MRTVYLAGPIFGQGDRIAKAWRQAAASVLSPHYEILDPTRRDYRGREDEFAQQIVSGDLADIDRSDVVLVVAPAPSWGTAMEIYHAASKGKEVIAVVGLDAPVSPWLRVHATHLCASLDEAVRLLLDTVSEPVPPPSGGR